MTALRRTPAIIIVLLALTLSGGAEAGESTAALYSAETIVSGKTEAERLRGFAIGAEDVLVKLTGQARLAKTGRGKSVIAKAPALIADYSYADRVKDMPVADEQGTRQRPYFLQMHFDAEKFDHALRAAKLKRWIGERPTVAVWLGVNERRNKYVLTREGDEGYGQRQVLEEASKRRAIPIILPPADQEDVGYETIARRNWGSLLSASQRLGADSVLYGILDYDGNGTWNCHLVVAGEGAYAKWKLSDVTFDKALQDAIDRVAAAHARRAINKAKRKK
jgi:uncharacterized protein